MNSQRAFAGCLTLLALACLCAGTPRALASLGTSDVTVTVTYPSLVINLNNLNFGASYLAINKSSSSASATVSPEIVLTNDTGTPGNARLIPVDASGANKLRVNITGGIPDTALSLTLSDDSAGTPFVKLVGQTTPADATFKVDSWTFTVQPGGGSLTGFNPATGAGVMTLNSSGEIDIFFGATLRTMPSALSYSEQDYLGTLRVTVNY